MRIALRTPGAVLAERARSGGWWARVAATRRDLQMVLRDLRGEHPPPLVPRAGRGSTVGSPAAAAPTPTPTAVPTALPGAAPPGAAPPGAAPKALPGADPTAPPGAAPSALPGADPTAPPGAAPRALPEADPTALPGAAAQAEVAGTCPATPGAARGPHRVTLLRGGGQVEVIVPAGRTILEAFLAVGLAMEFSCGMGGCGTCRVRLVSGAVELDTPNCLTPEERARGLVLACVARPRGACTIAGRG